MPEAIKLISNKFKNTLAKYAAALGRTLHTNE